MTNPALSTCAVTTLTWIAPRVRDLDGEETKKEGKQSGRSTHYPDLNYDKDCFRCSGAVVAQWLREQAESVVKCFIVSVHGCRDDSHCHS